MVGLPTGKLVGLVGSQRHSLGLKRLTVLVKVLLLELPVTLPDLGDLWRFISAKRGNDD